MQHIVVIGAGFGGIRAALELEKKFETDPDVVISIIDKNDYQLFQPSLYEVATAEEELTETSVLKRSITVRLTDIFSSKNIHLILGNVTLIDAKAKKIFIDDNRTINYDYLVMATGSVTDYFGVPGAEQYSFPLKTLKDALRIRNEISFTIQRYRMDVNKKNIRIIIAGGGYTGCEFVAELGKMLEILAWKNGYPKEKIDLVILEATSQLIPGLDDRLSRDTYDRLTNLGVRVQLSSMITKVEDGFIQLDSGEKEAFDMLIWTAGVKAIQIPFKEPLATDRKNRLNTKTCLQVLDYQNIFALGDCACIYNQAGRPVPATAQNAIHQAHYIADAVYESMQDRVPEPYQTKVHGFIVTLGGKWAILKQGNWYVTGLFGYLFRIGADYRYFASIIGYKKALKIIILQTDLYSRND
jgi:NADH dehydrogenase